MSWPDPGTDGQAGRHDGGTAETAITPPGLVNVANALTVLRLGLVPVFVYFLEGNGTGWRIVAFLAFGVASLTDLLDGELARRRGLITDFGKIADPIADKVLTGSALVTLSLLGEVAWWVTVVILFREVAVTGLRFWVIRRGVIAASRGGKAKTILQLVAISLYILPGSPGIVRGAVMAAAVALTIVTGIDYAARAMRLRRAVPVGVKPTAGSPAAGSPAASGPSTGSPAASGPSTGSPAERGPAGGTQPGAAPAGGTQAASENGDGP